MLSIKSPTGRIQIYGAEETLFHDRCFPDCLAFDACHDVCCSYGCDVDRAEVDRILVIKEELEPLLKIPARRWFKQKWTKDADFPSGEFTRSRVRHGKCVFYAHNLRGCMLHRYATMKGIDPHQIKPMVCFLFPATWETGNLLVAGFLSGLPCSARGVSVFEAQKREISYYFGRDLVTELEGLIPKI